MDAILLGEAAARGATMLEIRCGRGERHGRLLVKRLLACHGPDASIRDIMRRQIGSCPHRDDMQLYTICDPYWPTLAQLFSRRPDMAYVPMKRTRTPIICTRPQDYAPRRASAKQWSICSRNRTSARKRSSSRTKRWRVCSHMSGTVTPEFLAAQQTRILEEFNNMRADHGALLTTLQRIDASMTDLLREVRALHDQVDHIGHRIRWLEENSAS